MKVLIVNAGSSSLKYQFLDTVTNEVVAKGICERIGVGIGTGKITHYCNGKTLSKDVVLKNHSEATRMVCDALTDPEYGCISKMEEIEAVGHRIVHGGPYFTESCLLTEEVLDNLKLCYDLAPLHTEAHIMGITGCLEVMPNTPQVLVFDTSFHQTMPKKAYFYPLPYEMCEKYKIRRYGFHGTSHRYVSGVMCEILGRKENTKIVTCHLGNGSSISAVKDGQVIDTSMGFTPLEGLSMGTRCGSIDPAIVTFIMEKEGFTPSEMNNFMNKKCGFLGVSGISSDCRDIDEEIKKGPTNPNYERAVLTFDIFCYQIKKYIGSYAAAMGGLDAIVFTAGIGENNPHFREMVCEGLEFLGVKLDKEANDTAYSKGGIKRLSADDSRVQVYLIPTNEELVIAKDTERVVSSIK